jgi:hypothetical protein
MSDPTHERAISFNLGETFPADNPVSAFVVALSLAWKDLLYVNLRLVGGDESGPAKQEVSDGELRYLVGVAFAHLHEMRTCMSQARENWPEVASFLDGLSGDVQDDLGQVLNLNTAEHDWIEPALRYLRNQTFHYGAKTNWKDTRWALRQVSAEDGVISKANDTYAGTRLDFAELIWAQHLTRKLPAGDLDADDDAKRALEERQMRTLVEVLTTAINAAIRFAMAALGSYLNELPEGVVTWES